MYIYVEIIIKPVIPYYIIKFNYCSSVISNYLRPKYRWKYIEMLFCIL